jgi:hypothetical protein
MTLLTIIGVTQLNFTLLGNRNDIGDNSFKSDESSSFRSLP